MILYFAAFLSLFTRSNSLLVEYLGFFLLRNLRAEMIWLPPFCFVFLLFLLPNGSGLKWVRAERVYILVWLHNLEGNSLSFSPLNKIGCHMQSIILSYILFISGAGVTKSALSCCLQCLCSILECQVQVWLLCFCFGSQLMCLGKLQESAPKSFPCHPGEWPGRKFGLLV